MDISIGPEVEKFLESLENNTIGKVIRAINLLESFGHNITWPHSKKISANIFELRISGQQEVRIFYTFYKGSARLLHGFIKKSQKTPSRELFTALARLKRLT